MWELAGIYCTVIRWSSDFFVLFCCESLNKIENMAKIFNHTYLHWWFDSKKTYYCTMYISGKSWRTACYSPLHFVMWVSFFFLFWRNIFIPGGIGGDYWLCRAERENWTDCRVGWNRFFFRIAKLLCHFSSTTVSPELCHFQRLKILVLTLWQS